MLAVSTAYGVYSRATQVKNAINEIGVWLRYLSPADESRVRALLTRLERRLCAVEQPLSVCVLWCRDKGSAVSDIVHQVYSLVRQVEKFVISWGSESSGVATQESRAKDAEKLVTRISGFLNELEFGISALNLALSIVQVQSSRGESTSSSFSSSALLRASGRVREMHGVGGDVALLQGVLYSKTSTWNLVLQECAFKIHHNSHRHLFELHIDSSAAISSDAPINECSQHIKFELCQEMRLVMTGVKDFGVDFPLEFNEDQRISFSWIQLDENQTQTQFVFVMHGGLFCDEDGETDEALLTSFTNGQFRPLDVAYTAQLCIFENIKSLRRDGRTLSLPFHILASDEELQALLNSATTLA